MNPWKMESDRVETRIQTSSMDLAPNVYQKTLPSLRAPVKRVNLLKHVHNMKWVAGNNNPL